MTWPHDRKRGEHLKGQFTEKFKFSSFTHPHAVSDVYDFVFSVEQITWYFTNFNSKIVAADINFLLAVQYFTFKSSRWQNSLSVFSDTFMHVKG